MVSMCLDGCVCDLGGIWVRNGNLGSCGGVRFGK